jgi:hypothetical protein
MGRQLDRTRLAALLDQDFKAALDLFLSGKRPLVDENISVAVDALFTSRTQSFREAAVGSYLAKITDPRVNVRLPYAKMGECAYQGRAVDEDVVNPFLQQRQIPCSKGPYLAVFRRSVRFTPDTREGLRDKTGYDSFLVLIDASEGGSQKQLRGILRLLLWKFVELREQGKIELTRIQRLSLDQHQRLLEGLLQVPSGGLLPVILSVAMFQVLKECFNLDWTIGWQGINAADRASGVGGDITVTSKGVPVLAVEITERPIDRNRVVSTFNTKIAVHGLQDYLFLFSQSPPEPEARAAAQQYFGQGHDISFLPVATWLVSCLGTIGATCRKIFTENILVLLAQPSVPAHVKIAWNEAHAALLR